LLSLTVTDTPEQTRAVLLPIADDVPQDRVDLSGWLAMQSWLRAGPINVVIPFAKDLAKLVPPITARLHHDFKTVMTLIKAHALLHQASRERDGQGRIVAALEDYGAIRDLVVDLMSEGIELAVKPEVRSVVGAVQQQITKEQPEVPLAALCKIMELHKSSLSRRVGAAVKAGYLINMEERKGKPSRLVLGDPLPDDVEVLPSVARLEAALHRRTDKPEENNPPSPLRRPRSTTTLRFLRS
jgi:hypothetical protein